MAAAEQHVDEYVFRYTTEGVDQTKAKVDALGASLDKLTVSQDRSAASNDKGSASSDRAARAATMREQAAAKAQRQLDQEARALAQVQQAQDAAAISAGGLTAAQEKAASSAAAVQRAANDNAVALGKTNSAYAEAGKFAAAHPLLVIAGSALAARALAGLATSAAGYLGTASAATAAFAEGSTVMGGAVASGGTLAARGLAVAGEALGALAGLLLTYATRVEGASSAVGLLLGALRLIPPSILPLSVAFGAFQAASAVITKAYDDLARLIELGEKARGLDLSAPFVKSFESLGQKIEATTDQMDKALQQASGFVKERYGQANSALSTVSSLYSQGAFGAEKPASMSALETATTTQQKVQATLDAIKELQERGQEFAALDLTEKLFGPDVAERIRTGQASISQIVTDLQAATDKEVLKQEQVDRALALNKNIADTKQGISDALAVNLDFSEAAIKLDQAWLSILQTVKSIVDWINEAIKATGNFLSSIATGIQGVFSSFGNLPVWKQINEAMDKMGLMDKDWQKQGQTDNGALEIKVKPNTTIGTRSFPYDFGPGVKDMPKPETGAAKQAKQAADTAVSSYDNLIKRTQDHIDELNLEADSVGKDAAAVIKLKLAHDLARAAQKDGTEVTEEMRAEWDRLGDTLATSTLNLQKAKLAFEGIKEGQRELANDFTQFIEDITVGGQKLDQALQSLAKTLSSSALKAIISGEGPLAGILGTASDQKGQLGGLLGGKLNLGSLFGGGSDAAGSPLPGAQGPSLPSSSLFGGLFDTDKITSALGLGAETGIGKALSDALKPAKPGGGVFSSPLGQGLATVGAGAAIGYSTQSPLMGALGGGLAGLASGNPILAVAGAGAGLLGGLFGESQAKKQAKKQLQQELQARKEALDEARDQINALAINFEGGSVGNVGKQILDAQTQLKQAAKTASEGGDQALADKLMKDFQIYVARMTATFSDGFNGVLGEVAAGFGTNGPFSQAMSSVQQFGDAIKGFVADSARLGDPNAVINAQNAAVAGALDQLYPAPTLSETQTEMARIAGTAAGLSQVLKDLGVSADDAARLISTRTTAALDTLRDKFNTDLQSKINDAQGKSYLNDAASLVKEVAGLNADATAVGGDINQVQTYFVAAAQKIVDSSQLTGSAFQELITQFPQLTGLVHDYSASLADSADAMSAAMDRASGYQDRLFAAQHTSDSLEDQLAIFDRQADKDRAAEVKAGGQALVDLEAAQAAERANIIADFGQKAADALSSRLKGYQDRLFAASVDTSTLSGSLAAFDHQAEQDRLDEVKAGGEGMVLLEQTQAAERAKIIQQFWQQAQEAFNQFADTVKKWLDSLTAGANSPLSPQDRLAAAQQQYNQQLAAARAGDQTALGSITTYAQTLLDASKAFYASSQSFQDTFAQVVSQLTALPGQVGVGAFMKYATGGWVQGPGTSTSDSILARLSAGEFVMSAAAAAKYGPVLEAMNDDRPVAVAAPPRGPAASGTQGTAALVAEIRALRARVEALHATAEEGNVINEEGHLQNIAATKDVGAGIAKGNRTASRREVAA